MSTPEDWEPGHASNVHEVAEAAAAGPISEPGHPGLNSWDESGVGLIYKKSPPAKLKRCIAPCKVLTLVVRAVWQNL